ncbi:MAG TPA: GNAT family N-acetyltransferase [Longimicrobiales bacterium]
MQRLDPDATEHVQAMELVEAEVWADWLAAAPTGTDGLAVTSLRVGDAVAGIARGTDVLMYNRVVGLGVSVPATDENIDMLITAYGDARVPRWMIQWCPMARPERTVELLLACGFHHHNNWVKLYRSTRGGIPDVSTDLRIERIGGERRDAFADILSVAFGHERALAQWSASLIDRPNWRAFMAFDEATPVATGALFLHGSTGWLGFGATHPQYRGRGAQTALATTRLRVAQQLGCELVVLETAEDLPAKPSQSFRNMRRIGFAVAYARPNYVMVAGTPAAGVIAERNVSAAGFGPA